MENKRNVKLADNFIMNMKSVKREVNCFCVKTEIVILKWFLTINWHILTKRDRQQRVRRRVTGKKVQDMLYEHLSLKSECKKYFSKNRKICFTLGTVFSLSKVVTVLKVLTAVHNFVDHCGHFSCLLRLMLIW